MKSRANSLQQIRNQDFDVCVIGGGATGSGCALDAQLRGLKTVQIESGDFASGTSSASTKMVHGGVRYLEEAVRRFDPAEYEVVKRALRERIHMLKNAPFLTRTREFITPCYSWLQVAYFETGLKLYDWIAGDASLAPSHFVSRKEALHRIPNLNERRLVGAVAYTDGQFDDAGYNLALVETFARAGGEALNYARVIGFEKGANGKCTTAEIRDELNGESFPVRARAFVNATGPYADTIRAMTNPAARPRMRLSKGVHVVLPLALLASGDAMLIPKTEDGRVLFAIPWMGRLLVGTTEQEVEVGDELHLIADEVQYLLRHLNRYLREPVTQDQVVGGFAGARPLLSSADSRDTKKLARDHEVETDSPSGLISIMGGKWTTHRAMAEDTIDVIQDYLGGAGSPSSTLNHPLIGSEGYSEDYWRGLASKSGMTEATARHLAGKFGTRAALVLELIAVNPQLGLPLIDGLAPIRAEIIFAARHTMAMTIEDVLARRIGLQIYGWNEALAAAPAVADLLERELHWSNGEREQSLREYEERIRSLQRAAGLGAAAQGVS